MWCIDIDIIGIYILLNFIMIKIKFIFLFFIKKQDW
jgi:hypothetical protein